MLNRIIILLTAFSLVGCVSTIPMQGMFKDSRDQFSGVVTNRLNRTGSLSVVSLSGKKCFSEFVYLSKSTGEGQLICEDGRTGKFMFNVSIVDAHGSGKLNDGEEFVFYFGM